MTPLPDFEDVLDFWIGDATLYATALKEKNRLWFGKSEETDELIARRFQRLLETLAAGPLAEEWAARGSRPRLAAIIVLDQFSRNIFREGPRAFAQDFLALKLCKEGLALREDLGLREAERCFFYLPLEHSEVIGDQTRAIEMFTALHRDARPDFREMSASYLEYAYAHRVVIERFGRFPHRNKALARETTAKEQAWLDAGGGF